MDQNVHKFATIGLKDLLLGDKSDADVVVEIQETKHPLQELPNLDVRDANESEIEDWIKVHWKEVGQWKMRAVPAVPGHVILNGKTNV